MSRFRKNKENHPLPKQKPINSFFRAKKQLFEPNKLEFSSPVFTPIEPSSPASEQDDSPYLYEIRKKAAASKPSTVQISTSSRSAIDDTPLKRSGSFAKQRTCLSSNLTDNMDVIFENSNDFMFEGSSDESCNDILMESPHSTVMKMVEKVTDIEEEALCGDFSQKCILPVIKGKHPELHTISPETVAWLLTNNHELEITIMDCRYPYEFSAGHIKSAVNTYSKEEVDKDLFDFEFALKGVKSNRLLLFYCEFSSERAPNMMRFIRQRDRYLNAKNYPFVYYPELYLIEGGYKSFYSSFKELCEPQNYKPMLAKENSRDFAHYRSLCKGLNNKVPKE